MRSFCDTFFKKKPPPNSEEWQEIRLKRKNHRCPKCKSKDVTLREIYERDVRGLSMGTNSGSSFHLHVASSARKHYDVLSETVEEAFFAQKTSLFPFVSRGNKSVHKTGCFETFPLFSRPSRFLAGTSGASPACVSRHGFDAPAGIVNEPQESQSVTDASA